MVSDSKKKTGDSPLVSVVMPVYNTEKYLPEAIESILDQTFKNFEFIIIDDGSTDKSWEIIQKYAKKDERIKALQNKKNRGIGYTRNRLVNEAQTNFIASQDSDDISLLGRIQLEYNFLKNHEKYAVVSGDSIIIDENSKEIGKREYSDNIDYYILKKSPVSQPASMFRKDLFEKVGGYDNSVKYGLEDYDLRLRLYAGGYKIKNLPHYLLKYRIRSGQAKSKVKTVLKQTIKIQIKGVRKYGIRVKVSDFFYIMGECLLLLLPAQTIFRLFKKLEYRGKKSHG